jgi:hypothetical protein
MIALSLLDFNQLNTPETIVGLTGVLGLLVAVVVGFFYKRRQSKK